MSELKVGGLAIIISDDNCSRNIGKCVLIEECLGDINYGESIDFDGIKYISRGGKIYVVEPVEGYLEDAWRTLKRTLYSGFRLMPLSDFDAPAVTVESKDKEVVA